MARIAVAEISRHRAVASGVWGVAADRRRFRRRRRSGLPVSRSRRRTGPRRRGAGRRRSRRLDRGRDDGAFDRPLFLPRSGGAARHQVAQPRRARHRRHARDDPRRIPPGRLGRSGEGRNRLHRAPGRGVGRYCARSRGLRALRLEALHAQPAPEALAAPHRPADSAVVGRAGRHRHPCLRRGLAEGNPRRQARHHPGAGHFPHWEQPEEFVERLSAFVDGRNA